MTSNSREIALPTNAAAPTRIGQATAVEQTRAVAEVQARVIVAQNRPRNIDAAIAAMEQSCSQIEMAEKAKFRFSRGGSMVSGPSVYLARDLMRCWGNAEAQVDELSRDDVLGQSEMLAWAWDLETNTRVSTKFIVPHKRDKRTGPEPLVDMRDIYENNANAGARRLRECIINILPPWFVERAKALCEKTLKEGGGEPLPVRIRNLIARFEEIGVTRTQLEKKQGRGSNAWTVEDVAALTVIGRSLAAGETTRDDEFESDIPSAKEFKDPETVPAQKLAPAAEVAPDPVEQADGGESATETGLPDSPEPGDDSTGDAEDAGPEPKIASVDVAKLVNLLSANGVKTRADQVAVINLMTDSKIGAFRDLTVSQHTYLMTRIAALVEEGTFADTVQKARETVGVK
ncbi:MAG TPA: hypothetical protein VFG15_27490 [Amycolatopsis sp.]|nr:hypothetical protein [Amycolatopsis sp.]